MIKIYAVNGSPRKNVNTAQLLQQALDGAASVGADHCESGGKMSTYLHYIQQCTKIRMDLQ